MRAGLLITETGRSGCDGVFMRDEGRMETEDIILGKAKYEDWRSIYQNVWSRSETEPHIYHETGIALGPEYVGRDF